jgi:methyl-accepting chemotaxis protein
VQDGVQKVDGAGKALSTVVSQVTNIADLVSGISSESAEQAQGLNEINIGVSQLDTVTQQNASMVEQSGNAIRVMINETVGLNDLVGQFTLRGDAGGDMPADTLPAWQDNAPPAAHPPAEYTEPQAADWEDEPSGRIWEDFNDGSEAWPEDDGGKAVA